MSMPIVPNPISTEVARITTLSAVLGYLAQRVQPRTPIDVVNRRNEMLVNLACSHVQQAQRHERHHDKGD